MKKVILTKAILIVLIVLSGCADPVAQEIVDYNNVHLQEIERLQNQYEEQFTKAEHYYDKYVGAEPLSEQEFNELVHIVENESLPILIELIEYAENIEISSEEVRALHDIMLLDINTTYEVGRGFIDIVKAHGIYETEEQYYHMMKELDEHFRSAVDRQSIKQDFEEIFENLIDKYNIKMEE